MNPLYLPFLVPHLNYSLQFGAPLKKKGCKYIRCRELSRVLPVMSSAECYLFCLEEGMSWGAVCRLLPWNHQGHGTRLFVSCSPTMFNRNKLKKEELYWKEKVFHHEDSTSTIRDGTCMGCADSPWRFSICEQPWASWPELTLLGKDGNKGLAWHLFQPVLFCDYAEGALYETNRTAVSWSHNWEKNPNTSHKNLIKTNLIKSLQHTPSSNISYIRQGHQ